MSWQAGIVTVLLASGVVWTGCGGEMPEQAADGRSVTSSTESVEVDTADFSVDGMTCGGCAIATEMSVRQLEGVRSVDAGFDEESGNGWCTVEYDPAVLDTETIAGAIREAGFEADLGSTSNES